MSEVKKEKLLNFLSQFPEEIEVEELIEFIDLKSVSGRGIKLSKKID